MEIECRADNIQEEEVDEEQEDLVLVQEVTRLMQMANKKLISPNLE
jgi:hypothetical protein